MQDFWTINSITMVSNFFRMIPAGILHVLNHLSGMLQVTSSKEQNAGPYWDSGKPNRCIYYIFSQPFREMPGLHFSTGIPGEPNSDWRLIHLCICSDDSDFRSTHPGSWPRSFAPMGMLRSVFCWCFQVKKNKRGALLGTSHASCSLFFFSTG